jgi:hypothetical protein
MVKKPFWILTEYLKQNFIAEYLPSEIKTYKSKKAKTNKSSKQNNFFIKLYFLKDLKEKENHV